MGDAEICVFAISMDSSMGCVFPKPIYMNEDDDDGNCGNKENKSVQGNSTGWAISAGIMEAIVASFSQFHVDFKIIKYFSDVTNLFYGNTNSLQSMTLNTIRQLAKNIETTGIADVELAVEEVKEALNQRKYLRKHVHWFIDASSFAESNLDDYEPFSTDIDLHVYIIGNICQLHDFDENVKLIRQGFSEFKHAELHFLFSLSDAMRINAFWLRKVRKIENVAIPVDFFIANQLCSIKVKGYSLNGRPWLVKSMEMIGFLEASTMSTTFGENWKVPETDTFHIFSDIDKNRSKPSSSDLLWYLAAFLSDTKPGLVCLCECSVVKSNDYNNIKSELCLLVPVACELDSDCGLMVVRLRKRDYDSWKGILELDLVQSVTQKPSPIENKMYKNVGNPEKKYIKKRLDEIQKSSKKSQEAIDSMRAEYKIVGLLEEFDAYYEEWKAAGKKHAESAE